MSSTDPVSAYEGLLELLAANADRKQVLGFRLPKDNQHRLDELLNKSRGNTPVSYTHLTLPTIYSV